MTAAAATRDRDGRTRAEALDAAFGHLDAPDLVRVLVRDVLRGRIAVTSSFGAEAAVLLDMVAAADPATPVIMLETGLLFPETLAYRDALADRLGLTDVRAVRPDPEHLATYDPDDGLRKENPELCCQLRKVLPLEKALAPFEAVFTGRKRFHGGERGALPVFETDHAGRIKVNPLAGWSRARILARFADRGLPRHPLEGLGFTSIGCHPCTRPTAPGEDLRAGRWAGSEKTECGIHNAPWFGQGI